MLLNCLSTYVGKGFTDRPTEADRAGDRFRKRCLAHGSGLRAADPPRRGPPLVVPGRRLVLERVIERSASARAGAHPRRRLRQRAQHGRARPPRHGHRGRAVPHQRRPRARTRGVGEVIEGSRPGACPSSPASFDLAVVPRRDRAPAGRPRAPCASCAASSRPAAPCSSPCPPTSGCGADTTRSTTTTAATPAARCQRVAEQAGWETVRTTYFNSLLLPVAIVLRVARPVLAATTTESSLDLWVPPAPLNWMLRAAAARWRPP